MGYQLPPPRRSKRLSAGGSRCRSADWCQRAVDLVRATRAHPGPAGRLLGARRGRSAPWCTSWLRSRGVPREGLVSPVSDAAYWLASAGRVRVGRVVRPADPGSHRGAVLRGVRSATRPCGGGPRPGGSLSPPPSGRAYLVRPPTGARTAVPHAVAAEQDRSLRAGCTTPRFAELSPEVGELIIAAVRSAVAEDPDVVLAAPRLDEHRRRPARSRARSSRWCTSGHRPCPHRPRAEGSALGKLRRAAAAVGGDHRPRCIDGVDRNGARRGTVPVARGARRP